MKGMKVGRSGRGLEIPIGDRTIGRIFNALGDPLDGQEVLVGDDIVRKDILRLPPRSTSFQITKPEILETGIKVIDFLHRLLKAAKLALSVGQV